MTTAAATRRENSGMLFATPEIIADRRADGTIWLKSTAPLQPHARCVGDWLEHWARQDAGEDFSRRAREGRRALDDGHLQGRAAAGALGRRLDSGARV